MVPSSLVLLHFLHLFLCICFAPVFIIVIEISETSKICYLNQQIEQTQINDYVFMNTFSKKELRLRGMPAEL